MVNLSLEEAPEAKTVNVLPGEALRTDDRDLTGRRDRVEFPKVLSDGKPLRVSRETLYSRNQAGLPVQLTLRLDGDLVSRWRFDWASAPNDNGRIRGHQLAGVEVDTLSLGSDTVMATVRYDLIDATALSAEAVAEGLSPRIPEGYQVLDIDPVIEGTAAAAEASVSSDWGILVAVLVTATTVLAVLVLFRRRSAGAQ